MLIKAHAFHVIHTKKLPFTPVNSLAIKANKLAVDILKKKAATNSGRKDQIRQKG